MSLFVNVKEQIVTESIDGLRRASGATSIATLEGYPHTERAAKSNNAQIITMGARVIGPELAKAIVDSWPASEFDPKGASAANVDAINRLDEG